MKKTFKRIIAGACIIAIACIILMAVCNHLVTSNAHGKVFTHEQIKAGNINLPDSTIGLLLGTTPQSRFTGVKNWFFTYRIEAATQLYQSGAIKTILISGDEDSLDGINEVECMRDSLVAHGVPASAILLDGKGFRTINSVTNAVDRFHARNIIFISQRFHNERAIYLAEHMGIDINSVWGYNAKDPKGKIALRTYIREYFARVKMFLDLHTRN